MILTEIIHAITPDEDFEGSPMKDFVKIGRSFHKTMEKLI
jgi:hypothetical protein